MNLILDDAFNRIMGSHDLPTLEPMLDRMVAEYGFTASTYADCSRVPLPGEPTPYHVTTLDHDYLATYLEHDLLSFDPIVRRAASSNAPFLWSDCPDYRRHSKPHPGVKGRVRLLAELANDHGYRDGYVVPCHARDAAGRPRSALISLFWPGDPKALNRGGHLPLWFRLVAMLYHERILALRGQCEGPETHVGPLTDRECECLVWACRGKTHGETADILNVSERTVAYHIGNAMKKLGVRSKVHAVAMAVQMGLVTP
ncbi:MAG: LuxR C-terminal-related transcriptional regulator [Chromatiales bacterium]|jgi:DNA-binding CsgD family transcriptional regulator|nr:LuxR C-terminal-related transcriptional regulator [Chromatiales bacterium]MDX9767314.1 LuxR C-terminal-related transcriptional regulator [Ectothiorhodospiraceae bacterium]